ncbi:MAG TPA: LysM peptidoglycan-binding domain-containing protein [Opitutaceae bacterium]|nr:LysM peptidoglycan-binding domain-containing protein [Opitutaceae bacterium]
MNILKILGIVVAVHVVAFFLMFVNPGCRSTSQGPAPVPGETAPAAGATTGAQPGLSPAAAPADSTPSVSLNIPAPAPVRYSPTRPGTPAAAALENAPPADVTPATTYTVVPGDNLTKIAKKHGTTVAELEKANRLTGSARLSVGQKLLIPGKAPVGVSAAAFATGAGATYTVKAGDTLAVIARHVGSTSAELKRINNLRSDYVFVGQMLKVPAGAGPTEAMAAPASAAPGPAAAPVKKADGSVVHVVKPGETLGQIARKYQVKLSDLAVANNIADPKKIRPGQELVIPGFTAVPGAATGPATAPGATPSATPPAATPPTTAPTTEPAATPPAPPADQDLDSGLKPQNNVPVIKVEDSGAQKSP